METARGKQDNSGREDLRKLNPVTLDKDEHRKPITEYRKPKSVTLHGEEHRKLITEYRKPKPVTLDEL